MAFEIWGFVYVRRRSLGGRVLRAVSTQYGMAGDAGVDFCDLVGKREHRQIFAEAKGRTTATGLDVDTMYGQILRRMPVASDDESVTFAVVVPGGAAERAALRVPERVRAILRIEVYSVSDDDQVAGPH